MSVSLPPLYAFRHTNRSLLFIIDCFSYKRSRNMPSPHLLCKTKQMGEVVNSMFSAPFGGLIGRVLNFAWSGITC